MNRGTGSAMSLQEIAAPACPKHETYMIRETVDTQTGVSLIQGRLPGFRCPTPNALLSTLRGMRWKASMSWNRTVISRHMAKLGRLC